MPSGAASKLALTQCMIPFRTALKLPARPLFALTVAVTPSPRSEWSVFPSLASAFSVPNAPASSTLPHSPRRSVKPITALSASSEPPLAPSSPPDTANSPPHHRRQHHPHRHPPAAHPQADWDRVAATANIMTTAEGVSDFGQKSLLPVHSRSTLLLPYLCLAHGTFSFHW